MAEAGEPSASPTGEGKALFPTQAPEGSAMQETNIGGDPLPTENPAEGSGEEAGEAPTRDIANFSDDNKGVPQPPEPSAQKEGTKEKSDSAKEDLDNINKRLAEIYSMLKTYEYDPSNRKDPFDAWQPKKKVVTEVKDEAKEEVIIPTDHPTGEYNIKELKLVGIKWGSYSSPPKALFRTPDNVLHNMQEKDRIGNNRGVIYKMREDEVVIVEPNHGVSEEGEEAYSTIIVRLDRWEGKDKQL